MAQSGRDYGERGSRTVSGGGPGDSFTHTAARRMITHRGRR
ncbi:Uncharacterised protein [Amycolatopsis camponoti]|uniref:Uncharacterized protein n=1 Tax=Amycolatopsis camponoti TaxID=2606593 RepID=A0A6I8LJ90_9PSEU|nr:Uncharacterised protein [Amycolatopsis camponoti]